MIRLRYSYCEVFVKFMLPAARILIAKELIMKYDYTQLQAARVLGVSQALINYYISGRRRPRYVEALSKNEGFMMIVNDLARCISQGGNCVSRLVCTLCQKITGSERLESIIRSLRIEPQEVITGSRIAG